MKAYKIFSPAYKANGYHGTYLSIAICEDNGDFIKIIGDHANGKISGKFFHQEYTNINQIVGIPFSDADRFIEIHLVNINENILTKWEFDYTESVRKCDDWDAKRLHFCNGDTYTFFYDKKGKEIKENRGKYLIWLSSNPMPLRTPYYNFLNAIIHEN